MAYEIHDCNHCALHKVIWEKINVDEDDVMVYDRINIMINNAKQAVEMSALENLPDNVTKEDKELYIKNAMNNKTEAEGLMAEWWHVMLKKYPGLDESAKFDVLSGKFFKCVDERDVPNLNGEFIPKKN